MLLLLFNIENWTRYGDSETYIDIEVDDLHIMGLKYSSSNQEILLADISIDYIMIDSYLTVVTTTIQSVNKKFTNANVNK